VQPVRSQEGSAGKSAAGEKKKLEREAEKRREEPKEGDCKVNKAKTKNNTKAQKTVRTHEANAKQHSLAQGRGVTDP
jgi:hypothetical protein